VDDENKISIEPVKLYMYITIDADLGRRWVGGNRETGKCARAKLSWSTKYKKTLIEIRHM